MKQAGNMSESVSFVGDQIRQVRKALQTLRNQQRDVSTALRSSNSDRDLYIETSSKRALDQATLASDLDMESEAKWGKAQKIAALPSLKEQSGTTQV